MFINGSEILQSHDPKLVMLAAAICALGSFITLFLFAQAREMHGQARAGWLFLAGFAAGAVMWTTHFVALLGFQPGIAIAYDPALTGGAFFVAVILATIGLAVAAYGASASGFIGGGILGLGAAAVHFTAMSSMHVAGSIASNPVTIAMGVVLCTTCGALSVGRAHSEGRNVQVIAPVFLAAGICIMHFIGMAAIGILPSASVALPGKSIEPALLGYFVGAMVLLLISTGVATTMIARGARKEAQTQLRNIANASVEGLVLTDGAKILDFNESLSTLVGPERAAKLRDTSIWELIDYRGDRALARFEAQIVSDGAPVPVEVIVRNTDADGSVRRIFALRDLRERRAAEQRILYLAHFDTLTGLPNRASFQDRLENDLASMRARRGELALMILDLDRFKEVNDVHGHAAGDELLKATAARITALLSHSEFAARLGGDEFVIVQTARDQPASAARLADKLLEVFAKPVSVAGQLMHVDLTIGVAVFPKDGEDSRTLLANADLALYRAKEQGRCRACFFTPDMDQMVRERRILAQQLKQAIDQDELEIHYQAQASVATGEIIGFEALARWNHPVHGFIGPAQFIPIAEETDLILHLGEWVLRKVCEEAANWTRPYSVAVNVSPIQFKKTNLPDVIHQILVDTGMPPNRLELEITESALIEDLQRALDILRRIKALGVAIAMDDFGTGYSSLSTLQAFPFDKLKIDKSFVDKIGSRQQASVIVTAVLGLGRSLRIPVLAEGVETELQRKFLDGELCQQAQGYLFGRPVPLKEIRHIVFGSDQPNRAPAAPKLLDETRKALAS
ncbi:MAG TPA: EAL domain-containing protein [Propylenella sp.]|nr:EAL domain-containing protein [Propylenella sp.]